MKKLLFVVALMAMFAAKASAQFEAGKWYGNASLAGVGLSYSEKTDFAFGFNLNVGHTIRDNWMMLAEAGIDYSHSQWNSLHLGAKIRHYFVENGLFVSAGVRWLHEFKNINDVQITPEVGYCYFLGKNVTVEPCVYYDMSLSDFSDYSKVGVKVGIGLFF